MEIEKEERKTVDAELERIARSTIDDLEKYNDLRIELDDAFVQLTRSSKPEGETHEG